MRSVLAICVLALAAFVLIAATMGRHQPEFGTTGFTRAQLLRWRLAGYALLALSFWPSWSHWGLSIAISAWVCLIGFTGIAFGLSLTYFPRLTAYWQRALLAIGTPLGSFAPADAARGGKPSQ